MNNAPIGIFDSGIGGLTVARAVLDILPQESLIYVGDTKHTPYGDKDLSQVAKYSLDIMDRLVAEGVKMLVIACNTASCAILETARERYQKQAGIPVVEVIEPAVENALRHTRNGRVGVIGTRATIASGIYQKQLRAGGVEVYVSACPSYVPLAEAGKVAGPEVDACTSEYLSPLRDAQIDTLVLGCTHYPLLAGPISYFMGSDVHLVSSSLMAARRVYATLHQRNQLRGGGQGITLLETGEIPLISWESDNDLMALSPPKHRFVTTSEKTTFQYLASRIMGTHFEQSADKEEIW